MSANTPNGNVPGYMTNCEADPDGSHRVDYLSYYQLSNFSTLLILYFVNYNE